MSRLSMANTPLLILGLALVVVGGLGSVVSMGGVTLKDAAWWQRGIVVGVGAAVMIVALLVGVDRSPPVRLTEGFLGTSPHLTDRFVDRPEYMGAVVDAVAAGQRRRGC